jgi:phosphatidylethanolamine/phosphatidyl-N-methylethanolamine N-methyltransferase
LPKPNASGWRAHLLLLGQFVRNPRHVGAIAPSSRVLAQAMVDGLSLSDAARIVELGPGTGAFTSAIVDRLGPSARFLAIEVDEVFAGRLREQWPGLDCASASAASLPAIAKQRGIDPVDHILSGLPFASLPVDETTQILDGIRETLRSGGTFTTFQYVHAYGLPSAIAFREELARRLGSEPTRTLVVRNIPPAYVLRWTRQP